MIALCGVHVHEMDANSAFPAMAHDCTHLESSAGFGFLNSEVNFDFCSHRTLPFTQYAHSNGTQIS